MTRIFQATTKSGQTLVYCVAEGRQGDVALRELGRRCEGGTIKNVSQDVEILGDMTGGSDHPKKCTKP